MTALSLGLRAAVPATGFQLNLPSFGRAVVRVRYMPFVAAAPPATQADPESAGEATPPLHADPALAA
eukprot:CAMPEP_0119338056 /NCGR_PEP_ID=MMETSP1333-20130426/95272_1 /TAXON_ID=418940 /ORGANISM="Scyphosphaera apsteinii, Strain RCC1455" /LENGTH=66 /DNA_ID=CAMNT_0007349243 /DNA_START=189 /DNA_END=387 /DNA_ORIENTATION=+